jgi:hypothetical protein
VIYYKNMLQWLYSVIYWANQVREDAACTRRR